MHFVKSITEYLDTEQGVSRNERIILDVWNCGLNLFLASYKALKFLSPQSLAKLRALKLSMHVGGVLCLIRAWRPLEKCMLLG